MLIRLNPKNSFTFLLICSFTYLVYLIWTAKEKMPQFEIELRDIVGYVVLAVEMGGNAISRIFADKNLQIREKSQLEDVGKAELLTKADLISNHAMLGLLKRFPLLKVISEEKLERLSEENVAKYQSDNYELWLGMREALSKFPSWRISLGRMTVWVDPLDATQEFTEGLTQFVTVMACVVIDGKPFFGAIHKPFSNETVFGMVDHGLFDSNGKRISIQQSPDYKHSRRNKTVIVSRSHAGHVSNLIKKAFANETVPYVIEPAGGSGYKTLRLIQQTADIYIHTTLIKKWDLCAGDALIRAAGGALLSLENGLPLDYSVKSNVQNGDDTNVDAQFIHRGGIIMALRSPYSIYSHLKQFIH